MRLCVFCGSAAGTRPEYLALARTLGALLAREEIGLVYGGANVGVMGALADACLAAGGSVTGVMPRALIEREVAHTGLTAFHAVESMHERKRIMADLADGFIALPGGIGTFEELFEVWTWAHLGLHAKPVALLDVAEYWTPLVRFLDHAADEGFMRPVTRAMLLVDDEPARLVARLRDHHSPTIAPVITLTER
jgi:hypothetical protein